MRLFRRTLLCLVVGVTAFGVSGWLLRPKPNWEVDLGGADGWHRLAGESTCNQTDHPIWGFVAGKGDFGYDPLAAGVVWGVSSPGKPIRRDSMPVGEPSVAEDGSLVLANAKSFRDWRVREKS